MILTIFILSINGFVAPGTDVGLGFEGVVLGSLSFVVLLEVFFSSSSTREEQLMFHIPHPLSEREPVFFCSFIFSEQSLECTPL